MADHPEIIPNPDVPHQDSPLQDLRLDQLRAWLASLPAAWKLDPASLRPASSDASFRRYFRVDRRVDCRANQGNDRRNDAGPDQADHSCIVMDAPPQHEDCRPFLHVADLLARQGVRAPAILERDLEHGFLLLRDLGDATYADVIATAPDRIPGLYDGAIATLIRMQTIPIAGASLPPYDRNRLQAEMRLFPEWYVARHLDITLSPAEHAALDAVCERLTTSALEQAQTFVHRDFHSRNLMAPAAVSGDPEAENAGAEFGLQRGLQRGSQRGSQQVRRRAPQHLPAATATAEPGVLDFQDAVVGPITYDLVSLLRDAYVQWPEPQQIDWAIRYWEGARRQGLPVPADFGRFWRDFEWMGLQRSLKVLGIFARLHHRDGKSRYLADLPRVLHHTRLVAERYDAFAALARLLDRIHGQVRKEGYTF